MNVTVPDQFQDFIASKLEDGSFPSAGALVARALELMMEEERDLAALRAEIELGLEDERAGRLVDADDVIAELRAKYSTRSGTGKP